MRAFSWVVAAGLLCAAAAPSVTPSQAAPPPARGGVRVAPQSEAFSFTVSAHDKWQKTGIHVDATVSVDVIYASGRWTTVPGQILPDTSGTGYYWWTPAPLGYVMRDAAVGSLLGRVNPGNGARPFYLGDRGHVPDGLTGELELIANDDYYAATGPGFADNVGAITVNIFVNSR